MDRAFSIVSSGIRNVASAHANILPEEATINWYPGHMAKATSSIASRLSHCSHIIDLRDSRIPQSSANEALDEILKTSGKVGIGKVDKQKFEKQGDDENSSLSSYQSSNTASNVSHHIGNSGKLKRIVVFNKVDLAEPRITEKWKSYFHHQQTQSLDQLGYSFMEDPIWLTLSGDNSKTGGGEWNESQRRAFRRLLTSLHKHPLDDFASIDSAHGLESEELAEREKKSGKFGGGSLPFKPHVSMIMGVPNVGKSTLINQLTGRKGAVVTPRPATTRSFQLFKIDPRNLGLVGSDGKTLRQQSSGGPKRNSRVKLTPRFIELPDDPSQLFIGDLVNHGGSTAKNGDVRGGDLSKGIGTKTLWIMDTPGVMLPHRIDTERGLKLALCGNIADKVVPGSYPTLAKYLHHLLMTLPFVPKPAKWAKMLKLPVSKTNPSSPDDPSDGSTFSSSFNIHNYHSLMDEIGRTHGKLDEYAQAEMFILAFRSGKLGQISLELPPEL